MNLYINKIMKIVLFKVKKKMHLCFLIHYVYAELINLLLSFFITSSYYFLIDG